MNAYLDSSVVLRKVLGAPGQLREWSRIKRFVSSALLTVECHRTIDRLRVMEPLSDEQFALRVETIQKTLLNVELVAVSELVLDRASGSFPLPLKTLDAIHLATAVLWRDREDRNVVFATHDKHLGLVARMTGFNVLGR